MDSYKTFARKLQKAGIFFDWLDGKGDSCMCDGPSDFWFKEDHGKEILLQTRAGYLSFVFDRAGKFKRVIAKEWRTKRGQG